VQVPLARAADVRYMCPLFTQTDINFQRIPAVDTSNPFIPLDIHTRRIDGGDTLQKSAWLRFLLLAFHDPQ
jgi:hypothetical protein